MRTPLLPLASLALLLLPLGLPFAAAGTADDPEVTDPAGDVATAPAGFEWADITAAWLGPADDTTVTAVIDVVAIAEPAGEVGLLFTVGNRSWIAGWTTLVFPAPPFLYGGGFYCPAEADGSVPDPALCDGLEATRDESAYTIRLPRATFGLVDGAVISAPRGYAVDVVSAQPGMGQEWIEETAPGRDYVLPGATPAAVPPTDSSASDATAQGEAPQADAPAGSADVAGPRESPALPVALLVLALLGLALRRAR